ncbi:MAG: DUF1015 domain-containing protein [Chloroflexi bacterium]|nr:DUF1015 domain-containing protein [Chloroflexota bacterium]
MATIRPFRGCRYDTNAVGNLSSVICPPYDMIGPQLKTELQQRSPYNAVHLEGGEQPDPVDPQAGYQQAAGLFQRWLTDGVLGRDDTASLYLMRHAYDFGGRRYQHLGLFADILVEDYDAGSVLPHEFTREPSVLDRVALLDACQAQFSPIMSLYRDAEGDLRRVFDAIVAEAPDASAATPAGGNAEFWRIDDATTQSNIVDVFAGRPIFLADGHHRYEAALRYRRSRPDAEQADDAAASNYVMMTLVEFDDPGLLLLPYHRVAGGMSPEQLDAVRSKIDECFESRPLHPDITPQAAVADVARIGETSHCFAVFWADAPPTIHTLRPEIDWAAWGQLAVSEAWVLQEMVLSPVLGDTLGDHIDYSPDHEAIVQQVHVGEQQAAILLKPFPLEPFRQIVSAGNRLPPKSTFFYPKLPTGLVINQLSGSI